MFHVILRRANPAAAGALTAAALVVPRRGWTLAVNPSLQIYAYFPAWLQVFVMVVFILQGIEAYATGRASRSLSAAAALASIATAAVQGLAAFSAGAWLWWASMFMVQVAIYLHADK